MFPQLTHSFTEHLGVRGVHFYDSASCEFFTWDRIFGVIGQSDFPQAFSDLLVDTLANYDPDREFVAVSAGKGQLNIEIFKAKTL